MTARVWVCSAEDLQTGSVKLVRLKVEGPFGTHGVIVLRDIQGRPRAYLNLCRHIPIPLDAGSGRFLAEDRVHLRCLTHGAMYRPEDGLCVAGPCPGERLLPVEIVEIAGQIYVSSNHKELPNESHD